ncbi:MAG: hypothetical protein HOB33_13310 [Bacteroidetes Order II. Incertae sedis bacterium]|nr:hypothetical protein [Bacteroidetes Order II. bacterium]
MRPIPSVESFTGVGPAISRKATEVASTCDDEDMKLTGESPSPVETCTDRVAEVNCVVERRGGEQTEANNPAQSGLLRQLNSIRPVLTRRACAAMVKLVAKAMPVASRSHVKVATIGSGKVIGVSGVGKCHGISHETCAGARREQHRSQSPHSNEDACESRRE